MKAASFRIVSVTAILAIFLLSGVVIESKASAT